MKLESFDLVSVLEQVGKERNIDRQVLISAVEDAMLSAARKKLGQDADLEARYNEEAGEVEVYEFRRIVADGEDNIKIGQIKFKEALKLDPGLTQDAIGEDLGIKLDSREFGRIAAQNAKQIIVQRVKDAERMQVYNEYKDRKDEIVAGTVRRFERGEVVLDLGRAEAVIPVSEQIPKENIRINDRVVAYVAEVLEASKGSQIILSRAHPNLVVKLFEQEVPEIAEGIVSIESAAREPGFRTKISVRSKDPDVDPVGACVGIKGSRVQNVVQELKGEKIDIVPFEEDEARFVCNALAPAEVTRVLINEEAHSMQIIVPDDQLSLAIGRKGQNVRLASQLTGWKIDIQPESKATQEKEDAWIILSQMKLLSELQFQTLFNYGIRTLEQFLSQPKEHFIGLAGFNAENLAELVKDAENVVKKDGKKNKDHQYKLLQEAKNLLLLDELENSGVDLSIDTIFSEKKEILNLAGFFNLIDLALVNPLNLSVLCNIEPDLAKEMVMNAQNMLSSKNSNIKF